MDAVLTVDILVLQDEDLARNCLIRALTTDLPARVKAQASAREGITSFSRARFDAVIISSDFTDCWRVIHMVRSGKFGFGETPVFILCQQPELALFASAADPDTFLVHAEGPQEAAAQIHAQLRQRPKIAVLIIEDEPQAAAAAARALEKYYAVEIASDGETGLQQWRGQRHTLVILDLMLPGLTGTEVLRAIRHEHPSQLVVILTAHDAIERHQELMLEGAVRFLAKPVDLGALLNHCANVLREQRCLANAEQARADFEAFSTLAARVRAADLTLNRGQTAEASQHLRHAIHACRARGLTDDQWTYLISEFARSVTP